MLIKTNFLVRVLKIAIIPLIIMSALYKNNIKSENFKQEPKKR